MISSDLLFTGFESLTFNVYDNKGNLIYTEQAQDGSMIEMHVLM